MEVTEGPETRQPPGHFRRFLIALLEPEREHVAGVVGLPAAGLQLTHQRDRFRMEIVERFRIDAARMGSGPRPVVGLNSGLQQSLRRERLSRPGDTGGRVRRPGGSTPGSSRKVKRV